MPAKKTQERSIGKKMIPTFDAFYGTAVRRPVIHAMRVVIQRVKEASVSIAGQTTAQIGPGLLVLAGFEADDRQEDLEWTAHKIFNMRIFSDDEGKMNRALSDVNGEILVVSQFTLFAQTKHGNRPSFIRAAEPAHSMPCYEAFTDMLRRMNPGGVQTGTFSADMQVALVNDGPVTITMDSKARE